MEIRWKESEKLLSEIPDIIWKKCADTRAETELQIP